MKTRHARVSRLRLPCVTRRVRSLQRLRCPSRLLRAMIATHRRNVYPQRRRHASPLLLLRRPRKRPLPPTIGKPSDSRAQRIYPHLVTYDARDMRASSFLPWDIVTGDVRE